MDDSRPGSAGVQIKKGKKIVGFSHGRDTIDTRNRPRSLVPSATFTLDVTPPAEAAVNVPLPSHSRHASAGEISAVDRSHLPALQPEVADELRAVLAVPPAPETRPVRPALRRGDSSFTSQISQDGDDASAGAHTPQAVEALQQAYERGKRLELKQQRASSAPPSRLQSPLQDTFGVNQASTDIPLQDLSSTVQSDFSDDESAFLNTEGRRGRSKDPHQVAAEHLVQSHIVGAQPRYAHSPASEFRSGEVTPIEEHNAFEFDSPRPPKVRGGVLGMLLSLYNQHESQDRVSPRRFGIGFDSTKSTPDHSPSSSGATTPMRPSTPSGRRPYYGGMRSSSTSSLLIKSSSLAASPAVTGFSAHVSQRLKEDDKHKKRRSVSPLACLNRLKQSKQSKERSRITHDIREIIQRQDFLVRLCLGLMETGAPTHRLEEYLKKSADELEIEAQFLYIPGGMIISFDDNQTHTASVRLVRAVHGLDLGKLRDVHELFKEVVHHNLEVDVAAKELKRIRTRPALYSKWLRVVMYGLAAASVGPFAFEARLIDLPITFLLGSIVGALHLQVATRSDTYSNVFEVSAVVVTSFFSRAFGSIRGGNLFCFSALAQSSIAMILPGYMVLCASLELQSRSIIAGSVRMVYAIIYSLFLGFSMMIGTALYGRIDRNATSATSCQDPIEAPWSFIAVPIFTLCTIIINQGTKEQMPIMIIISTLGYLVSYYTSLHFASNTEISNFCGALAIGIMANLHSRIGKRCQNWFMDQWQDRIHPLVDKAMSKLTGRTPGIKPFGIRQLESGELTSAEQEKQDQEKTKRRKMVGYGVAAASMLPAIFVQVPGGLAASGSLMSGLATANEINNASSSDTSATNITSSLAFSVSISVVQVAIGITVGLFLATAVVYPSGKKRSGLFSF